MILSARVTASFIAGVAARLATCVALLLVACAGGAQADLPRHIDIRADAIGFYADHMLVVARGDVRLHAGARTVRGDSLYFDLMHNTLLVAGDVHVTSPAGRYDGPAYALNLPAEKATVLRLDPLPATFTVTGDDFAHAVEAPPAEGVFAVPDLGRERPYIRSTHVSIVPGAHIRFTPAFFPTGSGVNVPSPSYLYTFVPNPNFFVPPATLPAFSFDQPYELLGTPHSLLAGHLRYGSSSGVSLGLDEHLVDGLQRYAVASYLLRGNRFDVGGFEALTPRLSQTFAGSLGDGINSARYVLQQTSRLLTYTYTFYQYEGYNSEDLLTTTRTLPVGHLLSYKLSADYGFDAIEYGLPYSIDLRTTLGASVFTPSVRGPFGSSISGQYLLSSTSYDYPHQTGSQTTLFSLSRPFHSTLFYASASFEQVDDRYGLPPAPGSTWWSFSTLNGTVAPTTIGYDGVATLRTYYASAAINPNPNFNLLLALSAAHDFPQFDGYGRPPLTASFDLRIRPVPNLAIEYGRSYVFGWDLQHFTPEYTLSISP